MGFNLNSLLGLLGMGRNTSNSSGFGKSLSSFFLGDPVQEKQFQRFTPEQQNIQNQLLRQGMDLTDISGMENLARKRFQEETIPSIMERFTSMGAGGQGSSAFQSALGRAGSDLDARLGALRPQFGMQQLGFGLQPSFENAYIPASEGALQSMLGPLLKMLPMLFAGIK